MANIDYDQIPESGRRDLLAILFRSVINDFKDPAIRADFERWKEERQAWTKNRGCEDGNGSSRAG